MQIAGHSRTGTTGRGLVLASSMTGKRMRLQPAVPGTRNDRLNDAEPKRHDQAGWQACRPGPGFVGVMLPYCHHLLLYLSVHSRPLQGNVSKANRIILFSLLFCADRTELHPTFKLLRSAFCSS